MSTYNGWTNYETWKTHLEILDGHGWADADTLQEIVEDYLHDGIDNPTVSHLIEMFVSEVNFEEISEHLKDD